MRRAELHAALADPVRLGIVDELALSDRSPTELAREFELRSNLLAHHLDVLEAAGVIERHVSRGDRRRRYVRLVPGALEALFTTPVVEASGVVFVCTHNSARSQIAAALWNTRSPIEATSVGTEPADRVHPGAIAAARRHGFDLTGTDPTLVEPEQLDGRLVVTVCDMAHEELAAFTGTGRRHRSLVLHWSIADPAVTGTAADFDDAVRDIRLRVDALTPIINRN